MNMIFLDRRPFSHFVRNGFRQRVGRILHHLIHSDRVKRLAYVWWNEEPLLGLRDELPATSEFGKVLLHEARRARIPFARRLGLTGGWIDRHRIRRATEGCRELASEPLWIWTTDARLAVPAWALAHKLNAKMVCDLIDNFAVFDEFDDRRKTEFNEAYEDVVRLADRIVANNPYMQSFLGLPDSRFRCIMNGVDWEQFHDSRELPEPSDMRGILHPRVGFVGVLSSLTDAGLLNKVAVEIPECHVVCVGPTDRADQPLHPRIHCLGMKLYNDIPRYMSALDVGLSIYRPCPGSLYGDSQKVYEYLAAGIPVVATNAQDHKKKSRYVRVAGDTEEFVRMVRDAISNPGSPDLREERSLSVAEHDWKGRIAEILDFLSGEAR